MMSRELLRFVVPAFRNVTIPLKLGSRTMDQRLSEASRARALSTGVSVSVPTRVPPMIAGREAQDPSDLRTEMTFRLAELMIVVHVFPRLSRTTLDGTT